MKKKDKIVQFNKSGNGNITSRISIPSKWLEKIGVTEEDKTVSTYQFDNGDILITKNFKMEGIMQEELIKEAYNFGIKAKEALKSQKKKDKINYYALNLLRETKNENIDVMHYLLELCLETNIGSEEFFLDIIKGNGLLVQSVVSGLMS